MDVSIQQQFCTFRVAEFRFGVDVRRIQEVLRYQSMTRVPLAPPIVRGLINLRGQIVMAIDLRRRLDLPDRHGDHRPINIVVRHSESAVSFLVDRLCDVITPEADAFEAPPSTVTGITRELVTACCKLDGELLLILDADKVADVTHCVEEAL